MPLQKSNLGVPDGIVMPIQLEVGKQTDKRGIAFRINILFDNIEMFYRLLFDDKIYFQTIEQKHFKEIMVNAMFKYNYLKKILYHISNGNVSYDF